MADIQKCKKGLSNYATKFDVKKAAAGVGISAFCSLKSDVNKLDIIKLQIVSVYLKKLSVVVDNNVVKMTFYDLLVAQTLITTQKLQRWK